MSHQERPDWLRKHLDALPPAVPPDRDLWPGIRARLAQRRRGRWMPLAVAASLVISLGAALFAWQAHQERLGEAERVDALLAEIQAPYRQGRAEHQARWAALRQTLDPDTAAVIERNVAIIEAASAALADAVAEAPDSAIARELLTRTLMREQTLYRQAALLSLEAGPTTRDI
ncbi:MAG: hypothetical protein RIE74_01925 [Pseudomonadales bacterium]